MAITYEENSDDGLVTKIQTSDIELQQLIDQYIALRDEYQALGDVLKTVPDQETLDLWNAIKGAENIQVEDNIKVGAQSLYQQVQPIYNAGLLPTRYHDEYLQLEQFANS